MHTQIRHRDLLRLIGAYTIHQETKTFSENNHPNLSPFGTQQIVHSQIRHCNLLRLIGPSAKTQTILSKITIIILSPCWDAANVYPDQTLHLAAPNRGLHPSRKTYNSQQNSCLNLSLCRDGAYNVCPDQTCKLLCLIGVYTIRQETKNFQKITIKIYFHTKNKKIVQTKIRCRLIGVYIIRQETKNFQKIIIQMYLHVGTQQIMHSKISHRNLLRLIGPSDRKQKNQQNISPCWEAANNIYSDQTPQLVAHSRVSTPRGKPTILSDSYPNLSPCWDAANYVYPDQTPQFVTPNRGTSAKKSTIFDK